MTNSSCSLSIETLLDLGIPSTSPTNFYSCSTASSYTRFVTCCAPEKAHVFSDQPCYSWCDLPASLNARFDESSGIDDDAYSYMTDCLESDGTTTVDVLYCSAKPHVASSSPGSGDDGLGSATTLDSSFPTDTDSPFAEPTSESDICAGVWPPTQSDLAGYFDSDPGCAILPDASNTHPFEQCCEPAEVQRDATDCYQYCVLPRGDGFDGTKNLTMDQAVGSFKACMIKDGTGLDNTTLFGGMYCRANSKAANLSTQDFGAQTFLPSGASAPSGGVYISALSVFAFCVALTVLM